jgi:hypothetical protein
MGHKKLRNNKIHNFNPIKPKKKIVNKINNFFNNNLMMFTNNK